MSIYAERLHQLALLLDKVPRNQFNIHCWVHGQQECGFAGCALGWAATHAPFREQGLDLEDRTPVFRSPTTMGYGFWAAQYFFNLDFHESRYLFSARYYVIIPGPKDVAERVRKVLKKSYPNWTPPESPPEPPKLTKLDYLALTRDIVKGS